MSTYSVVIPVFNEEDVISEMYKRTKSVMETLGNYELIFVNDGSKDRSLAILEEIALLDAHVKIISFSKNFGHQAAVSAGLTYASGEAVVLIDADLQDPPEVILDMNKKWKSGVDVAYGQREKRIGESAFKLWTAKLYYRFLSFLTDVDIPLDTGDFRLMDRKVVDALLNMPEKNRFIRGMVSWVGFVQEPVLYERQERFAGDTKYTLKNMIKLALDGMAAFSYKPLKLSTLLGILFILGGCISFIVLHLQANRVLSTIPVILTDLIDIKALKHLLPLYQPYKATSLVFIGLGVVLLMLGVVGEYMARLLDEARDRPTFIVAKTVPSTWAPFKKE